MVACTLGLSSFCMDVRDVLTADLAQGLLREDLTGVGPDLQRCATRASTIAQCMRPRLDQSAECRA